MKPDIGRTMWGRTMKNQDVDFSSTNLFRAGFRIEQLAQDETSNAMLLLHAKKHDQHPKLQKTSNGTNEQAVEELT